MPSPLLYPIVAEVVLVTFRDVRNGSNVNNPIAHLPIPSQYTSVVIVFGGLSLLPSSFDRPAALLAWGFVIATALNVFSPGKTVNKTNTNSATTAAPTK